MPSVVSRTVPAPFDRIEFATVITSAAPAPVSMLTLWSAAPEPTVFSATPPTPIITVSVPAPPTTDTPENPGITVRSTATVSAS